MQIKRSCHAHGHSKRDSIFLVARRTEGHSPCREKLRGAVGCNNAKMLLVYRHLPNMTPESASESAAVDKMGSLFFAWGKTPTLETTPHRFPTVTGEQGAPQLRRIKIQKLETETRSTEDDDPRETADLCPERRRVGEDGRPRGGGGGDGSSHGWKKGGRPAGGRMDQRKEQGPPPPPSPPPVVLVARERERERERERGMSAFLLQGGGGGGGVASRLVSIDHRRWNPLRRPRPAASEQSTLLSTADAHFLCLWNDHLPLSPFARSRRKRGGRR
jgi:hypothetical protein